MAGKALPELEAAVIGAPRDAKAIKELRAAIESVMKVLGDRIRERIDEDGIVRTCDRVIDIGNQDCLSVYNGTFGIIKSSEPIASPRGLKCTTSPSRSFATRAWRMSMRRACSRLAGQKICTRRRRSCASASVRW